MTDLGKKDPLIPGQQLYGTMIPRPEYDYNVHRSEIVVAEKNMELFQSSLHANPHHLIVVHTTPTCSAVGFVSVKSSSLSASVSSVEVSLFVLFSIP